MWQERVRLRAWTRRGVGAWMIYLTQIIQKCRQVRPSHVRLSAPTFKLCNRLNSSQASFISETWWCDIWRHPCWDIKEYVCSLVVLHPDIQIHFPVILVKYVFIIEDSHGRYTKSWMISVIKKIRSSPCGAQHHMPYWILGCCFLYVPACFSGCPLVDLFLWPNGSAVGILSFPSNLWIFVLYCSLESPD